MLEESHKITRVIFQPNKTFRLRFHVRLKTEKDGKIEHFHKIFKNENNQEQIIILDPKPSLTMEIMDGEAWDGSKWLWINPFNIGRITRGFKEIIDKLYTQPIYYTDENGELHVYREMVETNTVDIAMKFGQRLIMKPTVIYDIDEVSYQGVVLYVNKTANYCQLSLDELEAVYHVMTKIDLFAYSQALLNYYVAMQHEGKIEVTETKKEKFNTTKKGHALIREDVPKTTSVGIGATSDPKDFFGL